MAWSYAPSNGEAIVTDKDRVRLLIGDVIEGAPLLQDEEIIDLLGQSGESVHFAASLCCSALSAKFAAIPHVTFGNEHTITGASVSEQYRLMATRFMDLSAQMDPPIIMFTGTTWTEFFLDQDDYDLKESPFDDVGDSSTPYRTTEDDEWLP